MGRRYIVEEVGYGDDGCALLGCFGIIVILGTIFQVIKLLFELTILAIKILWIEIVKFFQNSIQPYLPMVGWGILTLSVLFILVPWLYSKFKKYQRQLKIHNNSISLEELARISSRRNNSSKH